MQAESVRRRIRGEHDQLRQMLDRIEALAERFQEGDAATGAELRDRGLELYEKFAAHLDHEDAVLAPALRSAGPDGERGADRLGHEHREQRELLKYLIGRLEQESQPTTLVAQELRNFVGYVRYDMAHEEDSLLSEKLLHDEVVGERG